MDPFNLQRTVDDLTAKLAAQEERVAALEMQFEQQAAKDVSAIAKQVIDGLNPLVKEATDAINTVALTVNATATIIQIVVRRFDGATFKLGPEVSE